MCFIPVLISSFLFASVALAGHLPQHFDLVEKSTDPSSDGPFRSTSDFGATWTQTNGSFDYINGSFVVPKISGEPTSEVFIWIGIDLFSCPSGYLQLGVNATVSATGTTYNAFYQRYPDDLALIDIDISFNDSLRLSLDRWDPAFSRGIIENLTTGQVGIRDTMSTYAFCGNSAGWMVRSLQVNANVSLPNFGTARFTDAKTGARDSSPIYGPEKATSIFRRDGDDNHSMAVISLNESSVRIEYAVGN